jgi:hypothetical protein
LRPCTLARTRRTRSTVCCASLSANTTRGRAARCAGTRTPSRRRSPPPRGTHDNSPSKTFLLGAFLFFLGSALSFLSVVSSFSRSLGLSFSRSFIGAASTTQKQKQKNRNKKTKKQKQKKQKSKKAKKQRQQNKKNKENKTIKTQKNRHKKRKKE